MNQGNQTAANPLGTAPVGSLLRKFAVPSIVAMLVSALYNIVDQFFIGQSIGELGNAATNVAFPLSTSCTAMALRQIIGLFGDGSELYFSFAERYFHIYMFFTFINNIQPLSSTFFTSIGKPAKGTFLGLTRQIICLLPLIVIFPMLMGIDGIMYAGPIADFLAAGIAAVMLGREMKSMGELS